MATDRRRTELERTLARGPVLVTGAGGFIGRNLARYLARRGHPLTLVSSNEEPALRALPESRVIVSSAHRVIGREIDPAQYTALVHLACSTNPRVGTIDDELRQLGEFAAILEQMRQFPEMTVIFPSSGGTIYSDSKVDPHREDDPLEPRIPHAWGKSAAEELLRCSGRAFGLRHQIVRCANCYGPEQSLHKKQGLVMKLLDDLWHGRTTEIWGDGRETRDYIYVEDFCELIAHMIDRPEVSGTFNAGSGEGRSVNDIVELISSSVGLRPQIKHVAAIDGAVRHSVLDVSRAREQYGWRPSTPLAVGIRRVWEWLCDRRGMRRSDGAREVILA